MGKNTEPTLDGLKEHIGHTIRVKELDIQSREDMGEADEHLLRRSIYLINAKENLEKWRIWEQIILKLEANQQT